MVQNGALVATPAVDLSAKLCSNSERGLLGVAVDPAFATNGYVFLYYSFDKVGDCGTGTVNRVSRFVMTGNTLGGEVVLLDNIPSPAGNHNGGDTHFGKDGLLYVSVGDGGCDYPGGTPSGCAGSNDASRDRNAPVGKILRIDRDGNVPAGNPFTGAGTARCNMGVAAVGQICQETFAWGLRNPFRIAFDSNAATTRFHINDVGQGAWEEIDLGTAGADYGWNVREGHCANGSVLDCGPPPAGMTNPIFDYGRSDGCRSITGGAFVPNGLWPAAYQGKYLFADFGCGKIFRLDPNGVGGFTRVDFATALGSNSVVALGFGPAGATQALYYTTYAGGGQVRRIVDTRPMASIATNATPAVTLGGTAQDVATVTVAPAGSPVPAGTVTFAVFGPDNATCAGPPVATSTTALVGSVPRTATSNTFMPTAAGTYRWVATYNGDATYAPAAGPCNAPGETTVVTSSGAGRYNPLTPSRLLDTRTGTGGVSGPIGPGATAEVQVTGRGGVPASGVSAVVMNVTVTQPTAAGSLTVFPAGDPRPTPVSLTFATGKTVPNLVVVEPGALGKVAVFNSAGSSHVVIDVAGWYSDVPAGNAGRYSPVAPARLLDTRFGTGGGTRLGPGASLDLQVTGGGGVPATGVGAAVVYVAVTGPSASSFLTVYPTGEARPLAANLNFSAGDTVGNRAFVKLGTGGRVTIYNNAGSTDVIVDVNGWFTDSSVAGAAGVFTPLTPARILNVPVGAGSTVTAQVTGQGGVPAAGVSAVVLNATAVTPGAGGWLTAFPTGSTRPATADLNYAAGQTRSELVVVAVGTGGKVDVYSSAGAQVLVDAVGWIS